MSAKILRTATGRKPRVIRTVTLEAMLSDGGTAYLVLVHKGTGRTCYAASAGTLADAVAEFRKAVEWVRSQGLGISIVTSDDHAEALEMNARVDEGLANEDAELEALSIAEAAEFEATGELPAYLSEGQKVMVRAAYARRGRCPWLLGPVTEAGVPCTRWAGHPGGCTPAAPLPTPEAGCAFLGDFSDAPCTLTEGHAGDHQVRYSSGVVLPVANYDLQEAAEPLAEAEAQVAIRPDFSAASEALEAGTASVPAGGYPSPYAVATLTRLAQGSGRWVPSRGDMAEVEELEGRGFVVKIPGLAVRVLTESGREFTRRWILAPAPVRDDEVVMDLIEKNAPHLL